MKTKKERDLFAGITEDRLAELKQALGAVKRSFGKGEVIINQGDRTDKLGIVLEGSIEAVHLGFDGDSTLISSLGVGEIFADFLAANDTMRSPVALISTVPCTALFIPFESLLTPSLDFAEERRVLLSNLAKIYAEKYFTLMDRMICISATTIRDKIIRLLNYMHGKTGTATFELPFDREGLARYLNVDRSALSRELSKMKKEGLIEYYKNSFRITDKSLLRNGKFF